MNKNVSISIIETDTSTAMLMLAPSGGLNLSKDIIKDAYENDESSFGR